MSQKYRWLVWQLGTRDEYYVCEDENQALAVQVLICGDEWIIDKYRWNGYDWWRVAVKYMNDDWLNVRQSVDMGWFADVLNKYELERDVTKTD